MANKRSLDVFLSPLYCVSCLIAISAGETTVLPIPLIDLQPYRQDSDPSNTTNVVAAVAKACREIGFFAIQNHGVDTSIIERLLSTSASFFDLPDEEKIRASSDNNTEYPYGYEASENLELAKSGTNSSLADLKESFSVGPNNLHSGMPPRRIPSNLPELEDAITVYYENMEAVATTLLEIMAQALEMPFDWFHNKMDRHQSALRLLNYPKVGHAAPLGPGQFRASAHTDYGALTILKSGGPGLQVRKDVHGEGWIDVPTFDDDVFIINLGDMMQRWTNDKWVSTLHRVIVPQHENVGQDHNRRQSIAFFVNMNGNAWIETLPTCVDETSPLKYDPIQAQYYVLSKFLKSMGESHEEL